MHLGRNIARIRELKGMKQEALADQLGVTQQMVSKIEQSENIEDEKLDEIAQAIGVTPEAIKKFDEDAAVNIITNAFHDNSVSNGIIVYNPTFNPIDKIMEQASKIETLYQELLKSERDKITVLTSANKAVLKLAEEVKKLKNGKE